MDKKIYYIAMLVGSIVGGYVPTLFGADIFSLWSIFSSAAFALIFIFLAHRFLNY